MNLAGAPNRILWPPLVFGGAFLAGALLGHALPTGIGLATPVKWAGAVVMVLGAVFDIVAMWTMRRHNANILPHRQATALVTTGPFLISRNPIYLGNALLLAGAAMLFGNPYLAITDAIAIYAVTKLAIEREERHLQHQFAAAWDDYSRRVPRWLLRL